MSCSAFLFLCIILSVLTALPCTASAEKKADGKAVISEAYARQDGSIRLVLSGKENPAVISFTVRAKKTENIKRSGKQRRANISTKM